MPYSSFSSPSHGDLSTKDQAGFTEGSRERWNKREAKSTARKSHKQRLKPKQEQAENTSPFKLWTGVRKTKLAEHETVGREAGETEEAQKKKGGLEGRKMEERKKKGLVAEGMQR